MLFAWELSGGHFNPTITLGVYISEKKFGSQVITMLSMIVAQFAGAIFGILLAFLVLINKDYMSTQAAFDNLNDYPKIPNSLIGIIAPLTPNGYDLSGIDNNNQKIPFTRDWSTFWAMFFTSTLLVLAFTSIKSPVTRLSDNKLFQVFAFYYVLRAITAINIKFGSAGINPALASFYIMLEVSQYQPPNTDYDPF